jgi:hypothetical protein
LGKRVRQQIDPAENNAGSKGFSDPADGQGAESDAELDSGKKVFEFVLQAADSAGAWDLGGEKLFDAGVAGADHSEFGGHKEGVCQDQHGDGDNLKNRQTVHLGCEDSIRRGLSLGVGLGKGLIEVRAFSTHPAKETSR